MERLDKIIVCETDKGNYAVRPLNWAGYWDKDGKIKECGLNHIAVFHYKEDAEWYAETKNAEEQGFLLRLPCKIGDKVYTPCEWGIESGVVGSIEIISDRVFVNNEYGSMIGEAHNVFLTKEEAEQALRQMGE